MAVLGKFNYEISQSVSSSFQQGDTLELTFQAKGSSGLATSAQQKVNLFYSLNSESINWVEVTDFPKTFGIGTSYVTKSFTAPINNTWQAVKAIITGSVFTSSTFSQTNPSNPVSAIEIDYDDLKITSYPPQSQLTDEGLLVFRSPSQFIKVDEDGVQIKGGTIETERIVTEQLEVFGDLAVFGDFQASDILPYGGDMTDVGTSGANGTAIEYARGDHTHDLPLSTINSVIGEGQITSPLHATNITASATIHGNQIVGGGASVYDTAGKLVAFGTGRNSLIIQTSDNNSDAGIAFRNSGGAYSNVIYRVDIAGESNHADLRIAGGDSTSTITDLVDYVAIKGGNGATAGFVGIGNNEPSKKLTVEGEISASGFISTLSHITASGNISTSGTIESTGNISTDSSITTTHITASGNISSSGTGTNYFGGTVQLDGSGLVIQNDSATEITFTGTNNSNITSQGNMYLKAGSSKKMYFGANNTDSQVAIDTTGFVGIGTTSPIAPLHIATTNEDTDNALGDLTNPRAGILINNLSTTADTYAALDFRAGTHDARIAVTNGGSSNVGNMNFIVDNDNSPFAGMTLTSLGNVGIETESPGEKLEVVGNISASGTIFADNITFDGPRGTDANTIKFGGLSQLSSSKVAGLQWDFPNDDFFIYAHQSSSDKTRMVFESRDNLTDKFVFWFNSPGAQENSASNAFPLSMTGEKFVVNDIYERATTYHRDGDGVGNLPANNVDFFLLKSGSTSVSINNSLIHGNVSDSQVTINGDITASGNISSGGTIESTGNISTDGSITATSADINGAVDIDGGNLTVGTALQLTDSGVFNFGSGLANGRITWDTGYASLYGLANKKLRLGSYNQQGVLTISSSHENTMVISGSNVGIGTTSPESVLTLHNGNNTIGTDSNPVTAASNAALTITGSGGIVGQISMDNNEIVHYGNNLFISSQGDSSGEGDLYFRTGIDSVTNRMIIKGTGNVGIGTTTPSAKLDVSGDISASGDLILGGKINIDGDGGVPDATIEVSGDRLRLKDKSSVDVIIDSDDSAGSGDFRVRAHSGESTRFIVSSSGNVGIGTASPSNLLHLHEAGNSNAQLFINATGSAGNENAAGIKFTATNNYSQVGFIKIDDDGFQFGTTDNEDIRFFTKNNVESLKLKHASNQSADVMFHPASTTLFISQSGNIGIGTTTPIADLDIRDGHIKVGETNIYASDVDQPYLIVADDDFYTGETTNWGTYGMQHRVKTNSGGVPRLTIDTTGGERFSVDNNGKVGIGNQSPTEKLVVEGNISSSALGLFGGSIGVNGVSQSLSTFTTYPGLYVKQFDDNGGAVGSQNILIGGTEDINPTNAKVKLYMDGDHDGVLTTYQYNSKLKLKAGVSSSNVNYSNNWSSIVLEDGGTSGTNGKITFSTSGSERARIDVDGKVGIGTTSPVSKLHVDGDIRAKGDIIAENYIVSSSIMHMTTSFSSGNTAFGDDSTDTHSFTGSLKVLGDIIMDSDGATGNIIDMNNSNIIGVNTLTIHDAGSTEGIRFDGTDARMDVAPITSASDGTTPSAENKDGALRLINNNTSGGGGIALIDENNVTLVATGSNVGIGTASPTKALQVEGEISASGDLRITDGSRSLTYDVSGNSLALNGGNSIITAGAYNLKFLANTDGVGATDGFTFTTGSDAVPLMKMQANGNIGIGTASPDGQLDISSAGSPNIIFQTTAVSSEQVDLILKGARTTSTTTPINTIQFKTNDNQSGGTDLAYIYSYKDVTSENSGALAFGTSKNGSLSERMRITSDGDVGIGTTSPDNKLHLHQSDSTANYLQITNTTTGQGASDGFQIGIDADETAVIFQKENDDMRFGTNNTERVRILSSGNVGIGVTSPTEKLDVDGNIKARDKISSTTFESGFEGNGFRIETGSAGTLFTVDDLTVRGTMNVFELLIHQIRATNGSLFVSNTGKIVSASLDTNNKYDLVFDTGSGYGHSFQVGDLIRAQRFVPSTNGSGSTVFKSDLHIVSVNGTGSAVGVLTASADEQHPLSQSAPQPGYEYVRIGSTTTTDRQGSIYLTADDDNAPFIDVVDKVNAHDEFNTSGKVKTRIGKLDGITTSERFGTLEGYGFYASGSAFLEGSINATSGSIGDFIIDNTEIRDSDNDLRLKSTGEITASKALIKGNSKIAAFNVTDTDLFAGSDTIGDTGTKIVIGDLTGTPKIAVGSDADDISSTNGSGFLVKGDGTFMVGDADGERLFFDGSALQITSSNLDIASATVNLNSTNFNLDASDIEISSTQASMSLGEGKIVLQGGSTSTITIGDSNSIKFSDNGTDRFITIGSKTSFSHFNQSTAGLILGTDGGTSKFEIVGDANNYLSFDGSSFDLKSQTFFLGNGNKFISGSSSNIAISSSQFHLENNGNATFGGTLSAAGGTFSGDLSAVGGTFTGTLSGVNGDFSGTLTSTAGQIGGFAIGTNEISASIGTNQYSNVYLSKNSDDQTKNIQEGLHVYRQDDDIDDFNNIVKVVRVGGLSDTTNLHAINDYGLQVIARDGADDVYSYKNLLYIGAKEQKIGGFHISATQLTSSNSNFKIDSANNTLQLGTVVDFNKDGTAVGLFVDGDDGQFFVGKEDGDFIHFNGNDKLTIKSNDLNITASDIDMTTDSFELSATDLDISSTGKSISLGEGKIDLVGGSTSTITIGAANSIKFSDDGTDRFMTIGSKTSFSHFDQSTAGLILGTDNGTSKFEIVADTNNYLSFNGTAFDLKSTNTTLSGSNVEILTPSVFLGQGDSNFISASGGKIEISSSNFHLKEGNITASNVDLTGKITATEGNFAGSITSSAGRIADFELKSDVSFTNTHTGNILQGYSSGGFGDINEATMLISPTHPLIQIHSGSFNSETVPLLRMGKLLDGTSGYSHGFPDFDGNSDAFGIQLRTPTKEFFHISNLYNQIAGWQFDDQKLFTGTDENVSGYTSADGTLILSASGAIHGRGFYITKDGDAAFSGSVSSSEGNIGGFTLSKNSLKSSDSQLDINTTTSPYIGLNKTSPDTLDAGFFAGKFNYGGGFGDYHIAMGATKLTAAHTESGFWADSAGNTTMGQVQKAYTDIVAGATDSGSNWPTDTTGQGNYIAYSPAVDKLVINTPSFILDFDGNVKASGSIQATDGVIGGFTMDENSIFAGTKDISGFSTDGLTLSSAGSIHTPKAVIDSTGITTTNISATGGTISAFNFDTSEIKSNQLSITADGLTLSGSFGGVQEGLDNPFKIRQLTENNIKVTSLDAQNTRISSSKEYRPGTTYPACFLAGTEIVTKIVDDNSFVWNPIEHIQVGDMVSSYDTATNSLTESIVVATMTASKDGYYNVSTERAGFSVTDEHPFYVQGEWVKTKDLSVGDILYHWDNTTSSIQDISYKSESVEVYNFEVENTHNYFANETLVHNKVGSATVPIAANNVSNRLFNAQFEHEWGGDTTSTLTSEIIKHKSIAVSAINSGNNSGSIEHIALYGQAHPSDGVDIDDRLTDPSFTAGTANYWAGWFNGNVMIENYATNEVNGNGHSVAMYLISDTDKSSSIFLGEGVTGDYGKHGFQLGYDGSTGANNFVLQRHNNSYNSEVVLTVARTSNDVNFKGDVVAYHTSDKRLKKNVIEINDAVSKISQLSGMTFEWKESKNKEYHNEREAGIIAQDVQKVLPEAVKERDDGYLAVKYEQLIPLLIQGMKEQQEQINELESQIKQLKETK